MISPERVWEEEICETGMVVGLNGFVKGRDPCVGRGVDVFGLHGMDLGEVFDVDVDGAGLDTFVGGDCMRGHALGGRCCHF